MHPLSGERNAHVAPMVASWKAMPQLAPERVQEEAAAVAAAGVPPTLRLRPGWPRAPAEIP